MKVKALWLVSSYLTAVVMLLVSCTSAVTEEGFENVSPPKKSYLTDPLTFASYIRKRPITMINALWDKSVPREATLDFWEASGKPTIKWFPSTHTSIWLLYPLIRRHIVNFLDSTFGIIQ